jgi:hypothetical protein
MYRFHALRYHCARIPSPASARSESDRFAIASGDFICQAGEIASQIMCSSLAAFRLSIIPTLVDGALDKDRHRSNTVTTVL